jgi:hypothetical protein
MKLFVALYLHGLSEVSGVRGALQRSTRTICRISTEIALNPPILRRLLKPYRDSQLGDLLPLGAPPHRTQRTSAAAGVLLQAYIATSSRDRCGLMTVAIPSGSPVGRVMRPGRPTREHACMS